jgi:ribosomal protein S18 acetylase RimI-like enzyme
MTAITLSLARLGDAPAIANMSRRLVEPGLPWSWTPKRVAAHLRQREHLGVIARHEQELIGFVLAQFGTETVHLALLSVAEAHRRTGIGRQLVAWVEESAVVAGLFSIRLEVRATNQGARRFYTALGYSECGTTPGYYSGVEDAVRLQRDLSVTSCAR